MRYVLHIGTNKTGTSTLQHYLGTNRDVLQSQGILYPTIGKFRYAHHDLADAIKHGGDLGQYGIDAETLKLRNAPPDISTILISSEAFHTIKDLAGVVAMFPPEQTQVVLYLREHISYLASWYQQNVQAANALLTCSFQDFALIQSFSFVDLVDRWRAQYGKNLSVRSYNRETLVGQDIVEDFFATAFNSPPPAPRQFEDKNPSISGNLFFLKLMLNHVLTQQESLKIVEELSALAKLHERFQGRLFVSEQVAKRVAHRNAQDRKRLKEELGIVFTPPREGLAGNAAPDLATLRDDIAFLLAAARERRFYFYDVFLKKRDLMFPPGL